MTTSERITSSRSDAETTRREALRRVGGGVALAALASAALGGRVVAQSATPDADGIEGSHAVIRLRKVKPDRSGEELSALVREGFVPLVREVPGFVSYFVVWNAETRDWAAVGVFADKAGADESTSRAAEWGQAQRGGGANDYVEGDPTVVEGEVVFAAGAEATGD